MPTLSTQLITAAQGLQDLRPAWEDLHSRSADSDLSLHPVWLLSWWDVFGADEHRVLRVLTFFDQDRLVGLAPLLQRPHVYAPGLVFRRLENLGAGEQAADETCGDYLGILAERGREADVAAAFAQALVSGRAGTWDELLLASMDGDSPIPALLQSAFVACGCPAILEQWSASPYIGLPGTWDEYLAALKASRRAQIRKALRNFENWAGEPPVLHLVRSADDLVEGKRILIELHGERWTAEGVFASARFRKFHELLMPALLRTGGLELGWISARGVPVAAFYNFVRDNKVSFYQGGRRLDTPADVQVGVVMHACLIRSAIEAGRREYDFLAGVAQYKTSFALATRPILRLRVSRPSMSELARAWLASVVSGAKAMRDQARGLLSR